MLGYTGTTGSGHILSHSRTEYPRPVPDAFVDIWGNRVGHGRYKITHAGGPHLVFFDHYLREPVLAVDSRNYAGILLGEGNKIAVIVVADVFVIHSRQ